MGLGLSTPDLLDRVMDLDLGAFLRGRGDEPARPPAGDVSGRRRGSTTRAGEPIEPLKQALYPHLLPIARDWYGKLLRHAPWPDTLDEWLEMCHAAGQTKPTPILLKYEENGWNALHRDLYGDLVFPLQVVINLSHPGVDHTRGEFLLLEQPPPAQYRRNATLIPQGQGLRFTTPDPHVRSQRGWSAAPVRHGVSVIRAGRRFTLGVVFHDAA